MRNHDHQPLPRDLLDQLHDLHARFGIERAGRLVRKQDLRIVDESSRNGDALHLPARKLIRLFVQFVSQAHTLEGVRRPLFPLLRRNARKGEGEFHVPKHRLVRNEIVRLKHEADAVIAVRVPIGVFKIFRGDAFDHEVARRVVVESADDIQKRRFAAPGMAEYRNELLLAEAQAHPFQGVHVRIGDFIIFRDLFQR